MGSKLKLLLENIDIRGDNAEIIRENFRRIKAYLDLIDADKLQNLTQTIAQSVNLNVSAYNRMEAFDCTVDNQTTFTLTTAPVNPSTSSAMRVNGVNMVYGTHYTVAGTIVTFDPVNAGFQLEVVNEVGTPDKIIIFYMV